LWYYRDFRAYSKICMSLSYKNIIWYCRDFSPTLVYFFNYVISVWSFYRCLVLSNIHWIIWEIYKINYFQMIFLHMQWSAIEFVITCLKRTEISYHLNEFIVNKKKKLNSKIITNQDLKFVLREIFIFSVWRLSNMITFT
jgi:hypothetical protein